MSRGATPNAPRRITPVILSGGAGTRLWPVSRPATPKQLLALFGDRTMLQQTADRAGDSDMFEAPLVVAAAAHAEAVASQLGARARLILEPCPRNTAPAIALAALASDPEAMLLVMPSDHLIKEPERLLEAVAEARPLAEQGWLVTFGVLPASPETGFGYLRRGESLAPGVYKVDRFTEKPDAATAAAFLGDGRYSWNAGIFLFRAGAYLDALERHAPDVAEAVRAALPAAPDRSGRFAPTEAAFARVRAESVDCAVMEQATNVAMVPIDAGWSDVGSWAALHAASDADASGNAVSGKVEMIGSEGCLVRSDGPRIVAIGVRGLAIIVSQGTVLVVPLEESQRVSEAVALLDARGDAGA